MAKKTKVGLKVPTKNEILKKYGSIMELAEMFNTNKSMINKIIRYKFKELWQGRK